MTIEGEFYKLISVDEHSIFFDLELLYEISGKNPRKEYKVVAYGLQLEHALQKIINYAINKKYSGAITIKQYLQEYKKLKEEFTKEIFK